MIQNEAMFLLPPPVVRRLKTKDISQYKNTIQRLCSSIASTPFNTRPRSETRRRDVVKRKVALFVGYDGSNYHGIQKQKQTHIETLSDVFERALHGAGAISDENMGHLEKIKWQVSARTDRGVSAAGNVISAKLLFPRDEHEAGLAFDRTVGRVNSLLPQAVRVFGIRYITNSFAARTSCSERWYEYLLPASALGEINDTSMSAFCDTLSKFEGAHSFHNFTVGDDHSIPPRAQAMRFITQATCDLNTISLANEHDLNDGSSGLEWVRVYIRGQSFMLHQIRKMMSLAVLVHNGLVPLNAIEMAFDKQVLIDIPPAPAVGLFLDCCRFDWYNKRQRSALPHPITLDSYEKLREKFKTKYIFPSIALRTRSEDALGVYFRTAEAHPVQF